MSVPKTTQRDFIERLYFFFNWRVEHPCAYYPQQSLNDRGRLCRCHRPGQRPRVELQRPVCRAIDAMLSILRVEMPTSPEVLYDFMTLDPAAGETDPTYVRIKEFLAIIDRAIIRIG